MFSLFQMENNKRKFCRICSEAIPSDKTFLVKGTGKFDPSREILNLSIAVNSSSQYICKSCRGILMKRSSVRESLEKLDHQIESLVSLASNESESSIQSSESITHISSPIGSPVGMSLASPNSSLHFSRIDLSSPISAHSYQSTSNSKRIKFSESYDACTQTIEVKKNVSSSTNMTYPVSAVSKLEVFIRRA